jgi:hypothetical protein
MDNLDNLGQPRVQAGCPRQRTVIVIDFVFVQPVIPKFRSCALGPPRNNRVSGKRTTETCRDVTCAYSDLKTHLKKMVVQVVQF